MDDLKQAALHIFRETIAAIDVAETMRRKLCVTGTVLHGCNEQVDLAKFERVLVIALGKAAAAMVRGLDDVLPQDIVFEGIVVVPAGAAGEAAKAREGAESARAAKLHKFFAGHPVPDEQSWKAAEAILALLRTCDERTVIFFLLSGGGSALVELPLLPVQSLADVQQTNRALVTCGAPIDAMNTVRKHLSAVKGGRLTVAAGRATKITLAVSDVPAGKESALASGPTMADPTTLADFARVVERYGLLAKFPQTVKDWLAAGQIPETPKEGNAAFANAHFLLMLGMDDLFHPAHRFAEKLGCVTCCDNTTDDYSVEKAADFLLGLLEELQRTHPERDVALIADGEVSSPVLGNGVGGRNVAFVLACARKIAGKRVAVLSAGTDGIDGNSPAAGAVADGETISRGEQAGMDAQDYFQRSDAYTYFARLGDAIETGSTGNNLRDLRVLISRRP